MNNDVQKGLLSLRAFFQAPLLGVPGLGAVSRFFLGSIAEDSDRGAFPEYFRLTQVWVFVRFISPR